jgi:hypothetical protein
MPAEGLLKTVGSSSRCPWTNAVVPR